MLDILAFFLFGVTSVIESKNLDSKNEKKLEHITNFISLETQNIKIVNNVINTKSNLGFEELSNILIKFDISITNDIKIERWRIKQLLDNRNSIAHGDNSLFYFQTNDIQNIKDTLDKIVVLINIIKEKIKEKTSLILTS